MTPLRQHLLDALVLRGKAVRTQEAYIDAVARLARYYRCSPDTVSAYEVQQHLSYLLRERRLAVDTATYRSTASHVKNNSTSACPMSRGCCMSRWRSKARTQ